MDMREVGFSKHPWDELYDSWPIGRTQGRTRRVGVTRVPTREGPIPPESKKVLSTMGPQSRPCGRLSWMYPGTSIPSENGRERTITNTLDVGETTTVKYLNNLCIDSGIEMRFEVSTIPSNHRGINEKWRSMNRKTVWVVSVYLEGLK